MSDIQNTYMINEEEGSTVRIADEVVAVIAGLAATEVTGVASLGGGITGSMVARKGIKALSRGVKITVNENQEVRVDLIINLGYGYNIPEVAGEVQDKVSSAIENMIGMKVTDVNIKVAGIATEEDE
ncbi:MAG: Asp23/Gls24 family envelope stress response protein [Lachnospiraceae bacterium]|nr:Asp23/Gls24 family envelope stress response protein [Lachnospiraceae bacterium]